MVKESDEEMETTKERIKRKKANDSGPSSSEEQIKKLKKKESEKANTSSSQEESDASNWEWRKETKSKKGRRQANLQSARALDLVREELEEAKNRL